VAIKQAGVGRHPAAADGRPRRLGAEEGAKEFADIPDGGFLFTADVEPPALSLVEFGGELRHQRQGRGLWFCRPHAAVFLGEIHGVEVDEQGRGRGVVGVVRCPLPRLFEREGRFVDADGVELRHIEIGQPGGDALHLLRNEHWVPIALDPQGGPVEEKIGTEAIVRPQGVESDERGEDLDGTCRDERLVRVDGESWGRVEEYADAGLLTGCLNSSTPCQDETEKKSGGEQPFSQF